MKPMFRFFCLLVALATGAAGCPRTPDEVLIRQAIDAAALATDQLDASVLTEQLTGDFDGNGGSMRRQYIGNLLRIARFRGERLHAVLGPVDIEPRGERSIADFTVTLTSDD